MERREKVKVRRDAYAGKQMIRARDTNTKLQATPSSHHANPCHDTSSNKRPAHRGPGPLAHRSPARRRPSTRRRPIRQGTINHQRARPIDIRDRIPIRRRGRRAPVPNHARNVRIIAVILAPALGILRAKTLCRTRLVCAAGGIMVGPGVGVGVGVGAVEPDAGEEGEGADGEEGGAEAAGGGAAGRVGDARAAGVVAAARGGGAAAA